MPIDEIREGISFGVRKVNIGTDILLAMTAAMRKSMAEARSEVDLRKFLKSAVAAARCICKSRFEAFDCAGRVSRIKPLPLDTMAARYAKGELDPVIASRRQAA